MENEFVSVSVFKGLPKQNVDISFVRSMVKYYDSENDIVSMQKYLILLIKCISEKIRRNHCE